MRILLIHQFFLEKDDPGGSRFNEMTQVWAEQGHQVTVIAGMVNGATGIKHKRYKGKLFVQEKYHDNIEVLRCFTSGVYNVNFLGRFWGYVSFTVSSTIMGLFKTKGNFDITIASSPPLFVGIPAFILSKIKKLPIIFEVRDLWPESAIDTGVVRNKWLIKLAYWLEKFSYKNADLINTLTPAFVERLAIEKNVPREKLMLIPNGVDFSLPNALIDNFDVEQFRRNLGTENNFVITYVGAHGVANHLIQIIDAAELVKHSTILFVLIGDGMEKKDLIKEVEIRKLKNVVFIDPVPKSEIFKYIFASDVGISVLKKVDTFKTIYSNKTFDYMACKKPVLMMIDGISRLLVEEAECGVYVEPENPDELVVKIKNYIENPDLMQLHGKNGYHYVRQHFDRNVLAETYLNYMSSLTTQ